LLVIEYFLTTLRQASIYQMLAVKYIPIKFFRACVWQGGIAERKAMIDLSLPLGVIRQCELLSLPRSTFYHQSTPASELEIMRQIDVLHLQYPWIGSSGIKAQLARLGIELCRGRVRRFMRKMGIHAIYWSPRTTIPFKGNTVYPYLLKGQQMDGQRLH
jgi:putative transposase